LCAGGVVNLAVWMFASALAVADGNLDIVVSWQPIFALLLSWVAIWIWLSFNTDLLVVFTWVLWQSQEAIAKWDTIDSLDLNDNLTGTRAINRGVDQCSDECGTLWAFGWAHSEAGNWSITIILDWTEFQELAVPDWVQIGLVDDFDELSDTGVVTEQVASNAQNLAAGFLLKKATDVAARTEDADI